ncbi:MAG: SEC-C domain-containing protein [Acidobacteria bacterium]|nr:SEC-C domain-containing protein [Acidobacteriota bacterium]
MQTAGRNDPCPCGSGRKFRKCHGAESKKRNGIPAWIFFVLVAVVAGTLFYLLKDGSKSGATGAGVPAPSLPLPALPSTPLASTPGALAAPQSRFEDLPGISLASLNASQKKKFLDRVNSENCSCGCKGDTIARCVVQDPQCQIAPAMANRVMAEVQAAP